MKNKFYFRLLTLGLFLSMLCGRSFGQLVVTADSVSCGATTDTIRANFTGYVPTSAGITADDGWSGTLSIGFTFNFYGTGYTTCLIGSNGAIGFNTSLAGGGFAWSISAALAGNASVRNCILGPWCDMYIPAGGTISYATIGTAPYRMFVATWCHLAMYNTSTCSGQWTTSQIILYETTDIAEVHIAHKTICTAWNGGYAIVGVQNAAGSASTAAPSRDYPTRWAATNEGWRFSPVSGGSSYTASSITFAPIAYASSTIAWYDSVTGAYLGSGNYLPVNPVGGSGVYIAAAAGCDDSTKTVFHFNIDSVGGGAGNSPVHITSYLSTDPSICGVCNGTVSLIGINPHIADTVFYSLGGVPQRIIIDSAGDDSTITITGLCAGRYDYFFVKQGPCPSNSVGPIDIIDPPFTTGGITVRNPSICGACDGSIVIHGLVPGFFDTVRFSRGGVPQTPVVAYVGGTGDITLTGLQAGVYTNIVVAMNYCQTPPISDTLTNPPFGVSDTSSTNASCSACDGTYTLYGLLPSQGVTINYNFNGTPATPFTGTTTSAGTITLTNLCPGVYSNITATLNSCVSGACVSSPVGPITIVPPPLIPIRITATAHATECGACNGYITIKGLVPGSIDTIFYDKNGVPQTPVVYSAAADSSVVIYGLCAGDFNNFFIKQGPCPTTTISSHVVLVDPPIRAIFSHTTNYGCDGDTVNFVNSSTSPGSLHYVWDFGDGRSDSSASPSHIYPQGTYHIRMLASNYHCVDSASADITLIHPIHAAFTTSGIVCQSVPVPFTNGSIGVPPTYLWSFGDGTNDTATNPNHTFANVGTYTVKLVATNFIPCSDSFSTNVVVDSQTVMSLSLSDTVLCRGTYITLNGTYTGIGNTGIAWSFGDGDSIRDINPAVHAYGATGTFNVTATTSYRVCNSVSVTRAVTVLPQPGIDLGPDTSICEGGESTLILSDRINSGNTAASWLWSTGETTSAIGVASSGYYSATVTINNCQATDSIWVSNDCYMNTPNIFTPNGDGENDYFYPRSKLSKGLTRFKMSIYNRWGQLVFETTSVEGRGWDGRMNGNHQPEGVYLYVIEGTFKDGRKENHQGNVTLLR